MEGYCLTGQSPQQAVVPMGEEECLDALAKWGTFTIFQLPQQNNKLLIDFQVKKDLNF